ncbi:MAG TPA: bifunctional glutamate N-acetyltransferase/amino-acid acetyltransferase ArgJ [Actinomycetota bacterium]|nr:bifunctional glutamate N-acetyltransferase/amino-acid acetyltransferase ArgJ [Actinomycetota bacterium]
MAVSWPEGVRSAGVAAGIKRRSRDVGVIQLPEPSLWAGTFTRNGAAAASVQWCRNRLSDAVRAIVVNSGNANACTGEAGQEAVYETARAAATLLGCEPEEVLVASTGPIGVRLPVDKLVAALPEAFSSASNDTANFAEAILTTDSVTKLAEAQTGNARVVGVAKGAAMLAPNMATMLAFLVTDAIVERDDLQKIVSAAVERSFNRISVDACESTNDSVFLVTTGRIPTTTEELRRAVEDVCRELAQQTVADAEGGSRLVRIQVTGAADEAAAVSLGRAVAASDLWRSAVYGSDPNWGRVVAALGSVDRDLHLDDLVVAIGPETLFDRGSPVGSSEAARKVMEADCFTLSCVVGNGPGAAELLHCDLSPSYVELNAGGGT